MKQKVTSRVFLTGLFIVLLIHPLFSQNKDISLNQKASCPEKWWAVKHPLITKKAFSITKYSLAITDSLRKNSNDEITLQSGRLDAFKHAFWMASLVQEIHWKKAKSLGLAHEKANYRLHLKAGRKGFIDAHDQVNYEMDLWNNEKGIAIGLAHKNCKTDHLVQLVLDSIQEGSMKIVRINPEGKFLDAEGNILAEEDYAGKWINHKCLVPSK